MDNIFLEAMSGKFIKTARDKAKKLTDLEFRLNKLSIVDTLNLPNEIAYFIPLKNQESEGFFYMGVSENDLNQFTNHLKEEYKDDTNDLRNVIKLYCEDFYELSNSADDTYQKIEDFFNDESEEDFFHFEDEIKRDCIFLELKNEEKNIEFHFKFMFYEKPQEKKIEILKEEEFQTDELPKEEITPAPKYDFRYTQEELLNRIKEDETESYFYHFFQYNSEDIKKIFKNGDESYLVTYTKYDTEIKTDVIDSLEKAYFHMYYIFSPYDGFDSIWIDKNREPVFYFGIQRPEYHDENAEEEYREDYERLINE